MTPNTQNNTKLNKNDQTNKNTKGPLGDLLQRRAAERTADLKPPHRYVPWVTVNGVPLLSADASLERFICVAYDEADRPQACLELKDDDDEEEDDEEEGGGGDDEADAQAAVDDDAGALNNGGGAWRAAAALRSWLALAL
jgi:hypothetical protein